MPDRCANYYTVYTDSLNLAVLHNSKDYSIYNKHRNYTMDLNNNFLNI